MATKNVIIKDKTGTDELLPKTSAAIVATEAIAGKDTVESALSDLDSRASANASSIASAEGRISDLESSSGAQSGDLATLKGYFTDGAANKAVADADGNEISSTYAKEGELGIFAKAPKITSANIDTYISDSSIDSGKIVDGTIVDADISTAANIAQSKVAGLVAGLAEKASLSGDNAFSGDNSFSGNAEFDGTLGVTIGSVRLTESGLSALEAEAEAATSHIANKGNPHGVTKAQVGLGNVANVLQYSDSNHPGIGDVDGRQSLVIRLNGGTSEGTSQFTYDVSQAKTVSITPAGIGAATSAQGAKADSALQKADIAEGSADGTISVDGTDVPVAGLGSAAYTEASDYANAAQGALANTAVQPSDLDGFANGVVSYTPGSSATITEDMLAGYYDSTQVDNLLAKKVSNVVFDNLSGPFKQAKVPVYASASAIPTAGASVASAFNLGAWSPTAGNYVAFVFLNNQLNAVKTTYDGTSTWTWGEATPLSLGCQVMLEDGGAGHVYIVKLDAQTAPVAIHNVVNPIVGRIPLEVDVSTASNITLSNFSRADIKVKLGEYNMKYTLYLNAIKDCNLYFDTTNYSYPNPVDGRRQLTLAVTSNAYMFLALPYRMGSESTRTSPNIGNFGYFYGVDGFQAGSRTIDFCDWPRYVFDEDGKPTSLGFNYYIDEIAESTPGDTKKVCCHVVVNVDSAGIASVQPDPYLK